MHATQVAKSAAVEGEAQAAGEEPVMRPNDYYNRVVLPDRPGRPTMREAWQDYRRSLESTLGVYRLR